jgi:protein-arginine kinase activator protein McsA
MLFRILLYFYTFKKSIAKILRKVLQNTLKKYGKILRKVLQNIKYTFILLKKVLQNTLKKYGKIL